MFNASVLLPRLDQLYVNGNRSPTETAQAVHKNENHQFLLT
uniref:Uncharacterized protein n=1 Tax=Arundo donax TaxID=35708 RepID=A0A0A9H5D0_ARUDO